MINTSFLSLKTLTGGMVDTEQVSNLITLEIQAHEHWDSANFAFRPVCINETYK